MMAETETWKRGRPSQGLRQINIRYEIAEAAWRDIEDYCERIPYKHVNQGMLNALLMGSRVLLESTTSGQPSVPAQLSNTDASPSPGRPPAASHTVAAGQSASWVRARQTAGPRTFNIRYKVDEAEWKRGYAKGLELYCIPELAYSKAKSGHEYLGVCPNDASFLTQYDRGRKEYLLEKQIAVEAPVQTEERQKAPIPEGKAR